ncbi:MAG: choice-of-anchor I family protein [Solirubrobacterales bacterium]
MNLKKLTLSLVVLVATLAFAAPAFAAIGPQPVRNVNLQLIGNSPATGAATAEISAFDPISDRLFTTDAAGNQIKVFDLSTPSSPVLAFTIPLAAYGATPNSVTVSPLCGGRIVVAVEANPKTNPGKLVLFNTSGVYLDQETTGAQPDNVVTAIGGRRFISANEGEPSADGLINPDGTIGIATLRSCNNITHQLVGFGGAPTSGTIRHFSPGASFLQDLEPEFIAPAHGATALVTIQEANAVATLDIAAATVTSVKGIGFKDHGLPGNGLDPSDRDSAINGGINIATYNNVFGMYQPDAIASYRLPGDSHARFITANEGDSRDWTYYSEEARVKDLTLDPTAFSAADKADAKLGRLTVTKSLGDTDNDGDYDHLYAFGGRGVSLFSHTGSMTWDSGDNVEQYIKANDPANWNADGATGGLDSRSDNKGPEIEGITTGKAFGRMYAFAGSEREGGIFAFDLRATPGQAKIAGYVNARATATSPEGILFVDAGNSPSGQPLVITTNEVSGNVAIFRVS